MYQEIVERTKILILKVTKYSSDHQNDKNIFKLIEKTKIVILNLSVMKEAKWKNFRN